MHYFIPLGGVVEQVGALHKLLTDRVREKGRITFADFMAACLYEPGLGYYTSPGRKVGAEGDFYTSSNVHLVFGRLIGREICQMWETMGRPDDFTLMEVGAANGRLARDILDTIAELAPDFYAILNCVLIETEPSLKDVQRTMLGEHSTKTSWNTPAALAGGEISFSGCLYSNELIDSFPVHLVEMTPNGLQEVYVALDGDGFKEELGEPSTPAIAAYLNFLGMELTIGQRGEINLQALEWLRSVACALRSGFILTVDYGYLAEELFGPMRKNGTLLCYYQHKVEENPFIRVGAQDITSHVDFTTLMQRGEEFGLGTVWFGEQYRFLLAAGMMEEMMALEERAKTEEERLKNRLALKKLMLPEGGMGDTFKILIQSRSVANPQLLCMRDWGSMF
jgi:SAM-dependent MidA family methyltransferase